jgi:hypothetical protein
MDEKMLAKSSVQCRGPRTSPPPVGGALLARLGSATLQIENICAGENSSRHANSSPAELLVMVECLLRRDGSMPVNFRI